ncbi:MAG: Rpp14/Pop5 family protein [Nanoarchaeota archaeon]
MKLLPSLRERKRYVVVEVITEQKFSFPELREALEQAFQSFWGILGMTKAAPQIIKEKWNHSTQRLIIKVSHLAVDELKAALLLSKRIKNTPIILRSISTSGTLKQASAYL